MWVRSFKQRFAWTNADQALRLADPPRTPPLTHERTRLYYLPFGP